MRRVLLVVLLIACGQKSRQEAFPTLDGEDTKTTLPVPDDEHIPVSGPLRTGAPKSLVGVRMHVVDTTLLLFGDEQLEASNMIAKAVREAGLTVEEPSRTRDLFDRAARGLHVTTGQPCGAMLDRTWAAKRWRTELGTSARIETAVYCEDKCWIEVNLAEGIDPVLPPRDKRRAYFAAPYDIGQPWRTELPKRLAELVAFRSLRDFGPAKYVTGAVLPAATPDIAFADTNWTIDAPAALAPAMKQCVDRVGSAGVLVETDAQDKVTKCEPYPRAREGGRDVIPCVCNALLGKSLEGKGPRRAPVIAHGTEFLIKTTAGHELNVQSSWQQTTDAKSGLFEVKVSHPSITSWDYPSGLVLEPCFLTMPEGLIQANVDVTFDQVGKATAVAIMATSGTLTPAMEKCVHDAFMTSLASCPEVPTSIGYASVFASATKK